MVDLEKHAEAILRDLIIYPEEDYPVCVELIMSAIRALADDAAEDAINRAIDVRGIDVLG